jgi:hypothetical protein
VDLARVQTGARMEKRLLKVLKALAELYDLTLGDLLEGIVLHVFDGRAPFDAEALRWIGEVRREAAEVDEGYAGRRAHDLGDPVAAGGG